MNEAAARRTSEVVAPTTPMTFAGFPASAWAFAFRVWIAVIVALCVSFWLQLEAPSSAASTVAILALPMRGQALEKAVYRLIATIVGVIASIAIVGLFSQTRDLLLLAFAAWLGLCIFAARLLDGNRAYAATLAGYTVAFVGIQQIDNPAHVFESGMSRGAAIVVGIVAIALVNDLLAAPDSHPWLGAQLTAIHRQLREHARALLSGAVADAVVAGRLLRSIADLRPEMTSLSTESSDGAARSAAARSAAVAMVTELHTARMFAGQPLLIAQRLRTSLKSPFEQGSAPAAPSLAPVSGGEAMNTMRLSTERLSEELLRRDDEVRRSLAALRSGTNPPSVLRTPAYRSYYSAVESGLRTAICFGLTSVFYVFTGWPAAETSLSLVAVILGLGATTPNPRGLTAMALMVSPVAILLAGVIEFLILDGASEFALLAIALAPFVIGATLLMTRPSRVQSSFGRLLLIFTLVTFAPSNPQTYNPQAFLFSSFFLLLAVGLLLAAQFLVSPVSDEWRRSWLLASARREFKDLRLHRREPYRSEDAIFRDATRIAQIAALAGPDAVARPILDEALALFDRSATFRLCGERLGQLTNGPMAALANAARAALDRRDAPGMRLLALELRSAAPNAEAIVEASGALALASIVVAGTGRESSEMAGK